MPAERRILAVQTAFVGDLLLAIPLLKAIRERNPQSELWLLCRKGLGEFAERSGLADRAFEVDKSKGRTGRGDATAELLSSSFDAIYCPHESIRSALLVARLRAERKVGFRSWWNAFVFDARVERPMRLPDALRQLSLLAEDDAALAERLGAYQAAHAPGGLPLAQSMAGWSLHPHAQDRGPEARPARESLRLPPPPEWASMDLPGFRAIRAGAKASERAQAAARALGIERQNKQTLFIAPGSVWPTKRWRAEGFADAARTAMARGWNAVLFGTPSEEAQARAIVAAAPGARIAIGEGLSFYESCELLAMGDALLTNDSGAMHMAALSGLPTAAAFGPTTLDLGYRPWSSFAAVAQIDRPCRPCGKHGGKACPIGTHECMRDLATGQALRALGAVALDGSQAITRPSAPSH